MNVFRLVHCASTNFSEAVTGPFKFARVVGNLLGTLGTRRVLFSKVLESTEELTTYLEEFENEEHISHAGYMEYCRLKRLVQIEASLSR